MEPSANGNIYNYEPEKVSFSGHLVDFIQTLVVFAAIGTAVYLYVAQPHKVSGSSMFPNFHDGDYIITDKLSYRFAEPKRGDIVVFKNPRDQSQDFIKRIIGLPGNRVKIENNRVVLNGSQLSEPYLQPSVVTEPGAFLKEGEEVIVPENELLVFGDNRTRSSDSREWGYITKQEIIGKVLVRYWPPNAFGVNPASYSAK